MLFYLFFLINFFLIQFTYAANQTVGADDDVNLPQSHIRFDGGNNKIANYAIMDEGFSFLDEHTTCSFFSVFPVSGGVRLRGGTLNLNSGFNFSNSGKISTAGRIYGDARDFIISENVEDLNSLLSLNFVNGVNVGMNLSSIAWSIFNDDYLVSVGSVPGRKIFYFDGNTITFTAPTGPTLIATSTVVRWRPFGNLFAADNASPFSIPPSYSVGIYFFNMTTSKIQTKGSHNFGSGQVIDAVAWHPSGYSLAVGRHNNTERVSIWEINAAGAFTTSFVINTANANVPTTVDIGHDALSWSLGNNYLAVGFEDTGDNLKELVIYYFDEQPIFNNSTLTYTNGVNIGEDITHLDWSPTGFFIAVATGGAEPKLRIYEHKVWNGVLEEKTDSVVDYTDVIKSVDWSPDGNYLAVGKEVGDGIGLIVYKFDKDSVTLNLVDEYLNTHNVNSVEWSPNGNYVSTGDLNRTLEIYDFSADRNFFTFDNTNLILDGDFAIDVPVKFSGNCLINGKENKLTLKKEGQVFISSGCCLKIENLELTGINNNILCQDNSSSIIIQNSKLKLLGDFEFTTGSILFNSDVLISGSNKFIYTSRLSSTINSNSFLYFAKGMTFSYAPKIANRNLLYMKDETSWLFLDGCTLLSTSTGIRLTRGTLFLNNDVTFSCAGIFSSQAICFGNGNAECDLSVCVLGDADLQIYGAFEYENSN